MKYYIGNNPIYHETQSLPIELVISTCRWMRTQELV